LYLKATLKMEGGGQETRAEFSWWKLLEDGHCDDWHRAGTLMLKWNVEEPG
jgi:hypothetical protein